MNDSNNPLLCDPEDGVCEMPGEDSAAAPVNPNKKLSITYFTDPICSSCWGIEPQLRKFKLKYGHLVEIEYHMGGLLPDWSYNSGGISKPSDVAHHWDEVSQHYEMPIDGDVWLEDPLPSSYPPSIAFKAAQMQSKEKALIYLRVIREMVFLKKMNITRKEYLVEAAQLSGLDTNQFKEDLEQKAKVMFEVDLQLARQLGVRGFPTLLFNDGDGNAEKVYGVKPYALFEQALLKMMPGAQKKTYKKDWESLFGKFASLSAKEFAVLTDISYQEAIQQLTSLQKEGKLQVIETKNGDVWFR